MARKLYELAAVGGRRPSPFCWRAALALAHKGLDAEIVPVKFSEKERIAFSGQDLVPVLVDGETVVSDSWKIAVYLDETYPNSAPLFGSDAARTAARFVEAWVGSQVSPKLFPILILDEFQHVYPEDQAYFREKFEPWIGMTMEEAHATRSEKLAPLGASLEPLRATLADQRFVCGATPAYADYTVFSVFQWARVCSPLRLIEPGDPIHTWRERMLELFNGLARHTPAFDT